MGGQQDTITCTAKCVSRHPPSPFFGDEGRGVRGGRVGLALQTVCKQKQADPARVETGSGTLIWSYWMGFFSVLGKKLSAQLM